ITADASGNYIITGLESGIYDSILVTERVTGCQVDLGQVVIDEPDLALSVASTDLTSCGSNDGTITISGLTSGNNYTITYIHNSVTETLSITADASGNYIITGLESGIYDSILVTENVTGCQDDLGQVVIDEPDLALSVASTDLTSCGSNDGTTTLLRSTSGNNYTITYIHNSVTETLSITADASGNYIITGLESGIYDSILVTENVTGCQDDLGQ